MVTSYEVVWRSDQCPDDVDEGSATITETSYIIEDLREGTRYTITVSAINSAGTSLSDSVTGETKERSTCVDGLLILGTPIVAILQMDHAQVYVL